jgi:septal ring factor EnvC (AmiA/AmiB activator)
LRDVIAGQSKILDQMTRKVASTDKTLENTSTRMDAFASAIKNQHNFNKMIESQLAQLAVTVPPLEKGKILDQPEDLETANLVDIYNAANYHIEPPEVK